MLATRALLTGTFGPITLVRALTSNPDAGNSPWTVPGAIHANGKTHIGYVGSDGDIDVVTVPDGGAVEGPYLVHDAFEVDAHASPALLRRASDGRLIIVYGTHSTGNVLNLRVSTNPDDASAWGSATNLDSQLTGTAYADYSLWEYDGTLYLFYRDEPTPGLSNWCLSTCDAASPTSGWTAKTVIYRVEGTRSYPITYMDATRGILHFAVTNGQDVGFTKLGYFYLDIDAGTYHKSDGTDITSAVALDFTEVTEIYDGDRQVFAISMTVDDDGYPVIAAWDTISDERRYIYLRWDGAAWSSTNVASGDPGYGYNTGTDPDDYNPWGSCVDDLDPNILWVIEDVEGVPEVVAYITDDGGSTFSRRAVTSGSSGLRLQLICVRTPHTSLRVIWHEDATWDDYTDWAAGLSGAGL